VRTARFSDRGAEDYVADTLIARRHKLLMAWLNVTNPVVNVALDGAGCLTFQNAAVLAGVATPATRHAVEWSRFDNATGLHHQVEGEKSLDAPRAQAPAALLASAEFVSARLRSFHPDHPAWSEPLVVYFRRAGAGWKLVGLERNP
jgi:hypothetical protein